MATTSPPDPTELEASRAPFMEHLEELRWRLLRAIIGVVVAAAVCYIFHQELYDFLTDPLIAVLKARDLPPVLKYRTVSGAFMFHFKTAILGGIFFGVPLILYQFWQFVAPGLYRHERRMVGPFVISATLCFVGGAAFAYYQVLPYAFDFLLDYTVSTGSHRLEPDITVEDYLGFVTKLLLAFGLVFEMPIITAFLSGIGVITHRILLRFWRWAIVLAFIIAAVLTPPDYITQVMLAIPLCILYGVSILIARVLTLRRERAQADGAGDETPADDEAAADEDAAEPK
ncbi:MAG: twin-arginine translocase subunit TatC [Myxococcales bacterium]|nr:twin-arginine translocase subunit TatC [Myxococcales bacterium]